MIYIVGLGPGAEKQMTGAAIQALEKSDVIVGYPVYIELLGERFRHKTCLTTPMRQEVERCQLCYEEALKGQTVSLVCSGDAGIYGLASLMYEVRGTKAEYENCELRVIPGVTAASSGAAELGAPIGHDFCVISLSDLLTPWELIRRRLIAAAEGDFAIVLYNPSSRRRADHLARACDILLEHISGDTACGYVENIGRENTVRKVCTLAKLRDCQVNMFTTVFIGNSQSRIIDGNLITGRGYRL